MRRWIRSVIAAAWLSASFAPPSPAAKPAKGERRSPLDTYISEATHGRDPAGLTRPSPGSAWSPSASLADPAADLRARQVGDLVTILVAERASAVSKGMTKTSRSSNAQASVGALGGIAKAAGPLANLARLGGQSQLSGEGETSRETVLNTTLSARVTHVLPNGALVLEGTKDVQINAEHQVVAVRGMIRPSDLSPANTVPSERLAHLEVRIRGKGVVGDSVRRPFFLYRLLMGLLPF